MYRTIGEELVEMLERLVKEAYRQQIGPRDREDPAYDGLPRISWDLDSLKSRGIVRCCTSVTVHVDPREKTVDVIGSDGVSKAVSKVNERELVASSSPGVTLLAALKRVDEILLSGKSAA